MKSINRDVGPFLAFTSQWFALHQAKLLWLLNTPVVGVWFRWVMCIDLVGPIAEIQPHCITYDRHPVWREANWELQQITRFHTHVKYAKRIYYAFRPLWWGLHFWDWLVADRWVPELSFGFDTLTAFPAAGSNSPVDGLVQRGSVNETFSTIRSGAGNVAADTTTTLEALLRGSNTSNQFDFLTRSIFCFDTSALTAPASISSAVISCFGVSKGNGLGTADIHICGATPAATNTLASSDYGQLGSVSFANVAYASFSTSAYNDFTLNGSGVSNIDKTGISKFGYRLSWDINNSFGGTWGSFQSATLYSRAADQTGTSNDPTLTVTYSLVTFTPRQMLLGVP